MIVTIHFFDTDIAEKYGIPCAIILNHLSFWVEKNKANEKNMRDGYYWTYNSIKAMETMFPYMSKNTITRSLEKLEKEGLIKTGNYNETGYDRTKWYTLTELGESILPKSEIHLPKFRNGFTQSQKSIYPKSETNTIYKTDNESYQSTDDMDSEENQMSLFPESENDSKKKKTKIIVFSNNETLNESFKDFCEMRKAIKKPLTTDRAVKMLKNKLNDLAFNDPEKQAAILDQSTLNCWQSVYELKEDTSSNRIDHKQEMPYTNEPVMKRQ